MIDASTTDATGTVIEAGLETEGTAQATGSITASDIDASASLSYRVGVDASGNDVTNVDSSYGTFSVDGSGTWTYDIDNSAADSLDNEDSVTESFTVTVADGLGGTDTQEVVVTITGTNDAPVIDASTTDATGTVIEAGLETEGTAQATGSITASDIDASASLSYRVGVDASGNDVTNVDSSYGTFSVDGSGTWTYDIDNSAADSLDNEDSVTESFTVTVADGLGGTDTQEVVVTITGTNDAPVIDASTTDATGTVIEAGLETEGTAQATGSITASDIDASASLSYRVGVDASGNDVTNVDSSYGTFSVDGSGTWTYDIDNSAADSLDNEDSVTESFTVTVADGLGGTDTQEVVVTITGTNDAPVIDASTTDATGTVIEAGLETEGTAQATGSITASDIDASASLSYRVGVDASGNDVTNVDSSYGTFSVDGSGTWTYDIDNSAADSLDNEDSVTESFTVTVADGLGGTDTQEVVVTITGTNDAPVIDASTTDATGTVIEAGLETEGTAQATGSITASDIDASASLSYRVGVDASGNDVTNVDSSYGTFSVDGSGTWTYDIDNSAADSLDNEDSVTESFTVTVADGLGGTDTQEVVVTITGTNDAPVIDASTTDATGTVIEAGLETEGTAQATGSITASDIDASASLSYRVGVDASGNDVTNVDSSYGTFSVDGSGTWTYDIDNSAADSLDNEDSVTESFTVTVADGLGGTDTQEVVVTITGTNDAPVIDASTTDATGTVIEAGLETEGTAQATGSITASDIDASASLSYRVGVDASGNDVTNVDSSYGTFSVDGSGTWTYDIDNSAADSLDNEDSVTESFTVTVADGLGGTDTQEVVVTITGTNDAPVIDASTTDATGTVIEAGLETEGTAQATGSITASDIDASASLSYRVGVDASGNDVTNVDSSYGTFSVDGSGTWTYDIDNSAADSLDNEDSVTESFTVTVADGLGGTDTQEVVVTITGTNDAPVIDASTTDATGTVIEAGLETEGTAQATGSITASDIDASASLSYRVGVDASGNDVTNVDSSYGTFSVDGSGTWTYDIDNSAADSLDNEDSVTESFTVTVADGLGGTDTQEVVVTITGTNDAPVIDASTTDATGTVIEAGLETEGTAQATGSITASDIDASASLSYRVGVDASGNDVTNVDSSYGTFSVDGSGTWTYDIDNSAADSLDNEDSVTESFTVTVADGLGGTDTQEVVVTITGTNDAPVIDASTTDATGTVIEAGLETEGTAQATGSITASDIDASASLSYRVGVDASGNDVTNVDSSYGTFSVDGSGTWTYDIDNSAADSLDNEDSVTESFTVTVADGLGGTDTQEVVVTITGTNDAPVIDASTTDATGTVIEAGLETEGTAQATGSITASDIDASASLSYRVGVDASGNDVTNVDSSYGTFSVDGSGTWTYDIDNSAADSLDNEDSVTESFTVTVADGLGGTDTQEVVVTITGTNDAPVIDASTTDATGTVIEAGLETEGTAQATGSITASDIDASASLSYRVGVDASGNDVTNVDSSYGTFSVDGSGTWTYDIDNSAADSLDNEDSVTESFTVTVADGLGGTDTQEVVVTITGTNDAPVIDASTTDATGTVIEAGLETEGTAQATGSITASDIDASASLSYRVGVDASGNDVTNVDSSYGTFSVDGSGTWTYDIDNSAADSLDNEDSVTESFTVTVADGLGGTDTQEVVVTITGTNDAPVIDASTTDATGTVIEAGLETEGTAQATGSITASDIDASASLSYRVGVDASGNDVTNVDSSYGTFSVDGSGTWTYDIDNSAADSLDNEDSVTESFTVTVADGLGGTDTQEVVVTITGTNDAPVIDASTTDATGTVIEAGLETEGTAQATGSITASDIDASASLSYRVGVDASGNDVTNVDSSYGTFSVDGSGTWTYDIDNSAADSLDNEDSVTESFTVTVADGLGGTDTQEVVVTITGTNDAPVIDASTTDATGTVIEAGLETEGTAQATGSITASDIDASASLSYRVGVDASGNDVTNVDSSYGTFSVDGSGTWTYDIDNSAADSLDNEDSVTESFTVTVADGLGGTDTQEVVVTITGTNDAPVIDASTTDATGTVIEAGLETEGTAQATGSITASDIDASASLSYRVGVDASGNDVTNVDSSYGTFSVDGSGTWTYDIDNSAADSLDNEDSVTESFTVTVADGLGGTDTQEVVVTITGTNDSSNVLSISPDYAVVTPRTGADDTGVLLNYQAGTGTASDPVRFESFTTDAPPDVYWISSDGAAIGKVSWAFNSDGNQITGTVGSRTVMTLTLTDSDTKYSVDVVDAGVFYGNAPDIKSATANAPLISAGGPAPQIADIGNGAALTVTGIGGNGGNANKINGSSDQFGVGDANFDPTDKVIFTLNNSTDGTTTLASLTLASEWPHYN